MSLVATIKEAVRLVDVQRKAGESPEAVAAYLERVVRASWPFTREWKYLCDRCDDVGLVMHDCPKLSCGRRNLHLPHTWGEPCWCAAGQKFKGKPKPEPEDFSAAGKTKRPPSRFGR